MLACVPRPSEPNVWNVLTEKFEGIHLGLMLAISPLERHPVPWIRPVASREGQPGRHSGVTGRIPLWSSLLLGLHASHIRSILAALCVRSDL